MTTEKVIIGWRNELSTQQSLFNLPFNSPVIVDVAGTLERSAIEATYEETIPPELLFLLRLLLSCFSLLLFIVRILALRVFLTDFARKNPEGFRCLCQDSKPFMCY
jgi:hypothetical protein